jgi:hypothetical protein
VYVEDNDEVQEQVDVEDIEKLDRAMDPLMINEAHVLSSMTVVSNNMRKQKRLHNISMFDYLRC